MDIGKVIKTYRVSRDLTQEQLATASGVSRVYISQIERGGRNVTLALLEKLANVLEVPTFIIIYMAERERFDELAPELAERMSLETVRSLR